MIETCQKDRRAPGKIWDNSSIKINHLGNELQSSLKDKNAWVHFDISEWINKEIEEKWKTFLILECLLINTEETRELEKH